MTIAELKELIRDCPDDQFVHIRVWHTDLNVISGYSRTDLVVEKAQWGVDGSLLLTTTLKKVKF